MNHSNQESGLFKRGLFQGLPIGLGYIPLGIALGIESVKVGFAQWVMPYLMGTLVSGSAIAAALNLASVGTTAIITYVITFFVVNCRYLLLSLTMSQKLDPKMNTLQRMIFAFFNTDEIFGVAMQEKGTLKFSYLFGLSLFPYTFILVACAVGSVLTNVLPESYSKAFGILLYAMFIALIIPPTLTSKPALFTVIGSAALSVILNLEPIQKIIPSSYSIIVCALVCATIAAILFPVVETASQKEVK